jgi:ATP-dependent RNA helicase DDX23/PRP28
MPLRSWEESQIPQQLLEAIETIGYKEHSSHERNGIGMCPPAGGNS